MPRKLFWKIPTMWCLRRIPRLLADSRWVAVYLFFLLSARARLFNQHKSPDFYFNLYFPANLLYFFKRLVRSVLIFRFSVRVWRKMRYCIVASLLVPFLCDIIMLTFSRWLYYPLRLSHIKKYFYNIYPRFYTHKCYTTPWCYFVNKTAIRSYKLRSYIFKARRATSTLRKENVYIKNLLFLTIKSWCYLCQVYIS